ncbi:putative disease resistance protein RGA3 [Alnus glutinosa]|uniref:putative disease resistance protein RGA3 n=1 Tax=Alnus glutinosa TaxID=3517 RepID=UPI002D765766|nr:putative disease resistance protein RGA3 [Alnus glutinosa]
MGKLINLRHLNISGCVRLTHMPTGIGKLVHIQTWPIYIVGKGNGESIAELSCLNLRGELNIKCLENVRDAEEAKSANLKEKHLHVLGLFWGDDNGNMGLENDTESLHSTGSSLGDDSDARSREVEDILECLEPHPNLKKLFIKGYPGIRFPNWLLPSLTGVVLTNFKRCKALPTLGQLPFLKNLYLQAMEGIECIGQDFYGRDIQAPFPSLKELTLRDFPKLKEWCGSNGKQVLPCLEKLTVNKCPNLTSAPVLPSLQQLELQCCHPLLIKSMENLTSLSILVIDNFPQLSLLSGDLLKNNILLTSLKISSCPNLSLLPLEIENLTALKSLTICWCEELESLPQGLQNLKSLESLEIYECHKITSLPEDGIQGLSSLRTLSIENCDNLSSLSTGLQYLSALEHLTIMYCPELTSLPDDLRNLSALRSLSILDCPSLVCLPEGLPHVNTLQTLEIRGCPLLTDFTEWVHNFSSLRSLSISDCNNLTSLPEGLLFCNTLQHLSIQECPNLEEWWKHKRRMDGQKMANISHIYIGSPEFRK